MSLELNNFLRKENKVLKEDNKELKELLDLNREALKISSSAHQGQGHFSVLIKLLFEENSKLHRKLKELSMELETGMCKALISEQIAFASSEHEKFLTEQLKDRLKKMVREVELRDKKIIELTKAESDKKSLNNPDVKLVEVTDLNTLSKKFKDEIFVLRNEMENKRQELSRCREQKEELLKLNLILTKQINELKFITSQQSTDSKEIRGSGSGDLSKFMNYQKKIVQDEEDEEDSEDYENFDESSSEEGEEAEESMSKAPPKMPKLEMSKVPKLELSKAKEIQELIIQKINNDDNKKKGVMKEEKVKKMQNQNHLLKKKFGKLAIEKMDCDKENAFLKKFVRELESRNELLVNHRRMETMGEDYRREDEGTNEEMETLIDICRDVTMNHLLRDVVKGVVELPMKKNIISYDI